jgi:hypothetical protein
MIKNPMKKKKGIRRCCDEIGRVQGKQNGLLPKGFEEVWGESLSKNFVTKGSSLPFPLSFPSKSLSSTA